MQSASLACLAVPHAADLCKQDQWRRRARGEASQHPERRTHSPANICFPVMFRDELQSSCVQKWKTSPPPPPPHRGFRHKVHTRGSRDGSHAGFSAVHGGGRGRNTRRCGCSEPHAAAARIVAQMVVKEALQPNRPRLILRGDALSSQRVATRIARYKEEEKSPVFTADHSSATLPTAAGMNA